MTQPEQVDVGFLVNRLKIQDTVTRYLRGCEDQDWQRVLSCFVPNAPADYGVVGVGTIEDVVAILSAQMTKLHESFFLGSHAVEIDGDTAHSITGAVTVHHPYNGLDNSRNGIWGLRYLDDWLCDSDTGEWLIRARKCEFDWQGSFRAEGTGGWK